MYDPPTFEFRSEQNVHRNCLSFPHPHYKCKHPQQQSELNKPVEDVMGRRVIIPQPPLLLICCHDDCSGNASEVIARERGGGGGEEEVSGI